MCACKKASGTLLQVLAIHHTSAHSLCTGGEGGVVRLWDSRSGKAAAQFAPHESRVREIGHAGDRYSMVLNGTQRYSTVLNGAH